jgi:hypothetical protein
VDHSPAIEWMISVPMRYAVQMMTVKTIAGVLEIYDFRGLLCAAE